MRPTRMFRSSWWRSCIWAVIRQSGRLGDAPSRVGEEAALVYEWSDGLIERVTTYADIEEARAAAERLAEERG
jgi:hypothetical protein